MCLGEVCHSLLPQSYMEVSYAVFLMNGTGIGNPVTIPASGYLMIIFILQWDCLPGRVQPAEAVGHILWWKGMEHCIHVISIV